MLLPSQKERQPWRQVLPERAAPACSLQALASSPARVLPNTYITAEGHQAEPVLLSTA